jgi:hypothetical protein
LDRVKKVVRRWRNRRTITTGQIEAALKAPECAWRLLFDTHKAYHRDAGACDDHFASGFDLFDQLG